MAAPLQHVKVWKLQLFSLYLRRYSSTSKEIKKKRSWKKKDKVTFLDSLRVFVRGGAGGQGLAKHGGVGGDGGDVVLEGKEGETLYSLATAFPEKRFTAGTGGNSRKFHLLGEDGSQQRVNVPVGVVVKDEDGTTIGEVNEPGQEIVVAHGGRGGNSSNRFLGKKGEAHTVVLDLKLIADIGLVGFPNAGKSTFLGSVSRAKPKIADYPFTTIRPQIGTMAYRDGRRVTVADLPGLIEGAHYNFGMGHRFLKHIERTKLLLFMVDVGGFQLGVQYQHRTAFQTVLLLNKELELYREDLVSKPAVLAINKTDTEGGQEKAEEVVQLIKTMEENMDMIEPEIRPTQMVKFDDIFTISAKTGASVPEMKMKIRTLLDTYAEIARYEQKTSRERMSPTTGYSPPSLSQEHVKPKLV
ncbi:GTP-binding protein 10 homolog [Haliotis cracherodii]|uniref:GTP-binding protein 10 homolog n=1 Tax=Haliotis cracherodii TaxID=6455 RepID=UPI0039EBDB97